MKEEEEGLFIVLYGGGAAALESTGAFSKHLTLVISAATDCKRNKPVKSDQRTSRNPER